jgi:hypothetical protein
VKALQLLAGHKNIATSMRYVHPDQKDVRTVAAQVQRTRTTTRKKSR